MAKKDPVHGSSRSARTSAGPRTAWLAGMAGLAIVLVVVAAAMPNLLSRTSTFDTVDVRRLASAMERGTIVIDVREPYEHATGVVDGALLIPLAGVVDGAREIPKDAEIHVICRSGNRSVAAAQALVDAGYENVINVDGGMIAWQAAGFPIVR